MQDFREKIVVITGAASGIGAALARAFAAEGARIAMADIDEERLETTATELHDGGAAVLMVPTDVASASSVASLAEETVRHFGRVDVVCNNAGVLHALRPIWEFSIEYWQWLLGVNLWGVIHSIRTFVPLLVEQGTEAHFLNTASMAGLLSYPLPHLGMYAASKHAVVSLSETLAADLAREGRPIGVSVLCPGFVRTDIMNPWRHGPAELEHGGNADPKIETWWEAGIEAGTEPAEIAEGVLAGIRQKQLYILPHTAYHEAIRNHAEDLIQQRNPGGNTNGAGEPAP